MDDRERWPRPTKRCRGASHRCHKNDWRHPNKQQHAQHIAQDGASAMAVRVPPRGPPTAAVAHGAQRGACVARRKEIRAGERKQQPTVAIQAATHMGSADDRPGGRCEVQEGQMRAPGKKRALRRRAGQLWTRLPRVGRRQTDGIPTGILQRDVPGRRPDGPARQGGHDCRLRLGGRGGQRRDGPGGNGFGWR